MPLSRQISRMVWPSRPVNCLPSTSIVNVGADRRSLGRLRLEQALDRRVGGGASSRAAAACQSCAHGCHCWAADAHRVAHAGRACAVAEVLRRTRRRSSAFRSGTGWARSTRARTGPRRGCPRPAPAGPADPTAGHAARRPLAHLVQAADADAARDGLAARLVGQEALERRGHVDQARVRADTRRSMPEPQMAPLALSASGVYSVSSSDGGRKPPAGPPTSTALSLS